MKLNGIRAVTLDVGNTLIAPRVSVGETYASFAAAQGAIGLSAEEIDKRFRVAFRTHGGAVNTRAEWEQIVDTTFAGLLSRPPSQSFFPQLFDHFAQPEAWRIFDDVLPTLDALAQRGVRLGIFSNWDARLRPLLAALQLAARFEVIVVSCEVGRAKPAREIFDRAADLFQLPPADILHVGDSAEADLHGAQAAGFRALQLQRGVRSEGEAIGSLWDLTLGPVD